jgi:serine phosphatase RsbU (regulator of sigma subunit)
VTPSDDEIQYTIVSPGAGGLFAPEAIAHYLVAVEGAAKGTRVEVGAEPVTIGRGAQQTLAFPGDAAVSRAHARVSLLGGEVVVEDLGSTNGTFVDEQRLTQPAALRDGSLLRVGQQVLRYERRSPADVRRAEELERDLQRASRYVLAALPDRLDTGPVRTDWTFLPSAQLGGDAFGYYWLDADRFVFYLLDVSGHGVGSAMHSVTILNVLRQRVLPQVDFGNPAEVLTSLNATFPMDRHNGMYFTIWYGVYHAGDRTLAYTSAGHPPAHLVPPDRHAAYPLGSPELMIGMLPDRVYEVERTTVPPGSVLYLFSDGAYEIVAGDERRWSLEDFVPFLLEPPVPGTTQTERLYNVVRQAAKPGLLDDDFSLLAVTFE